MTEHLRWIMKVAKGVDMRVFLGDSLNGGFKSTPRELLRTPVPDPLGRHGNFGVNLCPSKPAGRECLLKTWDQLLDNFADPGLDGVTYWPYDEGGCGCKDCWPWGSRIPESGSGSFHISAQKMSEYQNYRFDLDLRYTSSR